jgi:hypothetical protein
VERVMNSEVEVPILFLKKSELAYFLQVFSRVDCS